MEVIHVNTLAEYKKEILDSKVPVIVDFWATWCMPCKMMGPILDNLALEMDGKIKIAKVNTEDGTNSDLAETYQIQSIPNMKLFKGGKIIGEFIGLRNLETLKGEIENLIK